MITLFPGLVLLYNSIHKNSFLLGVTLLANEVLLVVQEYRLGGQAL